MPDKLIIGYDFKPDVPVISLRNENHTIDLFQEESTYFIVPPSPSEFERLNVNSTSKQAEDYMEGIEVWCVAKNNFPGAKIS